MKWFSLLLISSSLQAATFQIRHFENTSEFNSLPLKDFNVFELDQMEKIGKSRLTQKFKGKKIICYISASYEDWRGDASNYPAEAKGTKMSGWNELWGNITRTDLQDFLETRFRRCSNMGAHYVEIDNTDISRNKTGFKVSDQQNQQALINLAKRAKKYGLELFLKNTGYLTSALVPYFAGVMNEQCAEESECAEYRPFTKLGKPVFQVEYNPGSCQSFPGHVVQLKSDYFASRAHECR